jgi:putative membrane protein
MTRYARWGLALMLLPLAGCGGGEAPPPAPAPAAPPPLSSGDSTFINQAAMGGLDEVQDGQLASQKAARPAVRQFAQQMVTDHTQINQQLTALAQRKGVTPPTQPDPQQTAEYQKMQSLRGHSFDRAYVHDQLTDHQQAVQLFQQEAQQGTDPDVKAFAQQTLPTLQQHLQMVESLEGRAAAHNAHRMRKEMQTH